MWSKSRFTVVHGGNNTIINNTRINSVSHTHNSKPTFSLLCINMLKEPKENLVLMREQLRNIRRQMEIIKKEPNRNPKTK